MSTNTPAVTGTTNEAIALGIDALQDGINSLIGSSGGSIKDAISIDIGYIKDNLFKGLTIINVANDGFLKVNISGYFWGNAANRYDKLEVYIDAVKVGHVAMGGNSDGGSYSGVVVAAVVAGARDIQFKQPSASSSYRTSRHVYASIEVH